MESKGRILSISIGDFLSESGGVNKTIFQHFTFYSGNNIDYFYIFPLRMKSFGIKNFRNKWCFSFNGSKSKITTLSKILSLLKKNTFSTIHIHHYPMDRIEEIEKIFLATELPIYFFIHDFFTFCEKFSFRDYCHFNDDLNYCSQCKENKYNQSNLFKNHFGRFASRMTFVAPSQFAKDTFSKVFPYGYKIVVSPHQIVSYKKSVIENTFHKNNSLRIAFVGSQIDYKGWNEFKEMALKGSSNKMYSFYQLGNGKEILKQITQINVDYHSGELAMSNSLVENNVDIAVLLSSISETYSFTFYECLVANVFIITCKDSGNIALQVKNYSNGIVLEKKTEFAGLLSNPEYLIQQYNEFRAKQVIKNAKLEINNNILSFVCYNKIQDIKKININFYEFILTALYKLYKLIGKIKK